jgi:hypothetical protein
MVKRVESTLSVENHRLIAKNAWKGVDKVLNISIFSTSLERKPDKSIFKKSYGMILESAGNATIKRGEVFSIQFLKKDFIKRAKGNYNRIIKKVTDKILNEAVKQERIKKLENERNDVINRLWNLEFDGKINVLNNWLEARCPGHKFIEKTGNNCKLLIYQVVGPTDKNKFFCSKYHQPAFLQHIDIETKVDKKIDLRFDKTYHLQSLEKFLQEDVDKEPNFFRKVGPLWVDFEPPGYMVERDEVDMIIENFEDNQSQLLMGDMASGKTVIARNVGYKLIKKGWSIYYLPSYQIKHERINEIVKEIETITRLSLKSIIIIEDLHEAPSSCSDMLKLTKDRGIDIRLLITTRRGFLRGIYATQERIFEPYKKIILDKDNFQHVADLIITNYKKIKMQKGEIQTGDIVEYHFESYFRPYIRKLADGNFWVLAYLLEGWSPYKLVDYSLIFKKIQKDFEELDKKFRLEDNLRHPVEVILMLAPFSERNLKISKIFFEDLCSKMGIDYATISRLIDLEEIEEAETDYCLPHQSISQLYMATINYIKDRKEKFPFLENLLALLGNLGNIYFSGTYENFELELFKAYLQSKPKNYGRVIKKIGNEMLSPHPAERITIAPDRFKRRIRWKNLFKDEKTLKSLTQALKEDDDIENIGNFLFGLYLSTTNAWLSQMGDIKSYSENPYFFKEYYNEMAWGFREFRRKKEYIDNIEEFLSVDDKDKLVGELDSKKLALRVNREENIENIRVCLEGINICCGEGFYRSFVENLDLSVLKSKLINQDSFITIVRVMHSLKTMDDRIVTKFKDILVSKVNSERNILHLGAALSVLIRPEYSEVFEEIIDQIDFNELMSKFEKDEDLVGIDFCIPCLKDFIFDDENIAQHLIDILPPKIDAENQPARIFRILGEMAVTNELGRNVVGNIINHMDHDLFKSKLIGEHKHAWCEFWDIPVIKDISGLKLILDKLNIWEVMTDYDIKEINRFFEERNT